jgi:hypothetical protein
MREPGGLKRSSTRGFIVTFKAPRHISGKNANWLQLGNLTVMEAWHSAVVCAGFSRHH